MPRSDSSAAGQVRTARASSTVASDDKRPYASKRNTSNGEEGVAAARPAPPGATSAMAEAMETRGPAKIRIGEKHTVGTAAHCTVKAE